MSVCCYLAVELSKFGGNFLIVKKLIPSCCYLGTVWPDLAKFCQFCQIFNSLGNFWMVYLVFGKLLYLLWHFYATGQIGIAVNGQRLNNKKPSGHTGLERRQRPSHTLPALAAAAVSQELVPMTWQENVYLFIVLVTPNVGGRQHIWSWSSLVERGETLYRPKW